MGAKGSGKGRCIWAPRSIIRSLCCLITTGPLLAIIGIILIVTSFSSDYQQNMDHMEDAISDWKMIHKNAFEDLEVSVLNIETPDTFKKMKTTTREEILWNLLSSLPRYDKLLFQNTLSTEFIPYPEVRDGEVIPEESKITFKLRSKATDQSNTIQVTVPTAEVRTFDYKTMGCDAERECKKKCRDLNGFWRMGECKVSYILEDICVRVYRHPDHGWTMNSVLGETAACGYSNFGWKYSSFADINDYKNIHRMTVFKGGQTKSNFPGTLRVRHVEDPTVVAAHMTKGTFSFGLHPWVAVVIGFVLIGTGSLLVLFIVLPVVLLFRVRRRRRHYIHVHQHPATHYYPPAYPHHHSHGASHATGAVYPGM